MAIDYLGSPEGYAASPSDQELQNARDMAQALITGKSGQQVPYHWTQAVSNVLHSLEGRSMLSKANREDRAAGTRATEKSNYGDADTAPVDATAPATSGAADGYDTPGSKKNSPKLQYNWGPNPLG